MVDLYGILGDGAQADETEDFALPNRAVFRAVSSEYLDVNQDSLIDITGTEHIATPVVAAVGAPGLRRQLVEEWPGIAYYTVVAPSATVSASAAIGPGSLLAPQSVVSTNARIGAHALLNIGSSVSHDSVLGDFVTLSPGARVAGRCTIGDGVFIGIGAVVSNGLTVAAGTVIGAGAVVVEDIVEPGVYTGVPARRTRDQEGWLRAI
jgi:sugar O-acyltransferase (sialic acid O-acetyltransferase NeuD family)